MKQETGTMSRTSSLMKRSSLIALAFCALTILPLQAEDSDTMTYPMGTFHWDLDRLGSDAASQIRELKRIGYTGMTAEMLKPRGLVRLGRYQEAIGDDDSFKIYSAFEAVYFEDDLKAQLKHVYGLINILKQTDTDLWIIARARGGRDQVKREEVVAFLDAAAERAKQAGIEVILYPHSSLGAPPTGDVSLIESAEEAIPYLEAAQSDNLFVSLTLTHETKAGNVERIEEIAAKIKPWLRMPSLNGTDIDAASEVKGFKRTTQPLGRGTYDSSRFLKALRSIEYEGPVLLYTFHLNLNAPADHHQISYEHFQEMVDGL